MKSQNMGKTLGCLFFVLILIFAGWFYWKYYYTYSDGNRSGLLQKFSHKGNAFKTYEGELVLSSVLSSNAAPISTEKFYFTVVNDSIAKLLMNYEGKRVTLQYEEKNGALFWRGDSRYVVNGVREATE